MINDMINDIMLKWDKPMTSNQAAGYHLTRGFIAVELYRSLLIKDATLTKHIEELEADLKREAAHHTEIVSGLNKANADLDAESEALKKSISEHNKKNESVPTLGESSPATVQEGLLFLARWFDAVYQDAGTGRDVVQQDLRRWAKEINDIESKNYALKKALSEHSKKNESSSALATEQFIEAAEGLYEHACRSPYKSGFWLGKIFTALAVVKSHKMPAGKKQSNKEAAEALSKLLAGYESIGSNSRICSALKHAIFLLSTQPPDQVNAHDGVESDLFP